MCRGCSITQLRDWKVGVRWRYIYSSYKWFTRMWPRYYISGRRKGGSMWMTGMKMKTIYLCWMKKQSATIINRITAMKKAWTGLTLAFSDLQWKTTAEDHDKTHLAQWQQRIKASALSYCYVARNSSYLVLFGLHQYRATYYLQSSSLPPTTKLLRE